MATGSSEEIARRIKEGSIRVQEAELLIQKLNDLGLGEHISHEDFLDYYERLPHPPPSIDTDVELEDEKLRELGLRHTLYRFRYCKYKLSKKGNNLEDDWPPNPFDGAACGTRLKANDLLNIPEADCTPMFIKEQGYFKRFETDGTLDWSFPSDYINCALLNDYQRLVPRNYGGSEYIRWSEYHQYLNSYEIDQEYVEYCEELAKQLKWMEDYIHFDRPSFKYDFISSRGAYQAIKIAATGFRGITPALAYNGCYECIESMGYDLAWLKELDGVYFEIWRRVTEGMSFRDALAEVFHLNRFPSRQHKMKHALEFDEAMEEMEEESRICTAAITPEVKEDKARELIAGAVKELVDATIWHSVLLIILWKIWDARNAMTFKQQNHHSISTLKRILDDLMLWTHRMRKPDHKQAALSWRSYFFSRSHVLILMIRRSPMSSIS